jgi:hypothetical protein
MRDNRHPGVEKRAGRTTQRTSVDVGSPGKAAKPLDEATIDVVLERPRPARVNGPPAIRENGAAVAGIE